MGRIPDEDVQKVRDATDVVALVSETVALRRKGRLLWGLCPFHGEKTASFKVDPATQLWHCFGCGEGGDVFGFVMRTEHLDFPDAVRRLADRAGIEVREVGGMPAGHRERLAAVCDAAADYYHTLLTTSKERGAEEARRYLKSRGFGIVTAKRYRLGYAPARRDALVRHLRAKGFSEEELVEANVAVRDDGGRLKDRFFGRIMFPIADLTGKTIAFGGRVVGKGEPKYLNSQETQLFRKSATLYALDRARNEIVRGGAALVVEGYTDVIALHEAGVGNVVATLGTALTAQHVRLLSRFAKRVVYLFDGDEAGKRAAARAAEFLGWQSTPETGEAGLELLVAVIPGGRDPADLVAEEGADALRAVVDEAVPLLRFVIDGRLEAHDLGAPEGRAAALSSAAKVLAGMKGSLLAQDYANYVADRLVTDYATVQSAMLSAKPDVSVGGGGPAEERDEAGDADGRVRVPEPRDAQGRAERELARVVAIEPSARGKARELLEEELVGDPFHLRLIEAVVGSGNARGAELFEAVSSAVPEAADMVSAWLVEAEEKPLPTGELQELATRLKEFRLKRQIIQLQTEMEALDPLKQRTAYDDLFREIAALQRRLKSV